MAKVAYLECPTGISGDMCLGALVDLGVPLAVLEEQLGRLGIGDEFMLRAEKVLRNGQQATKVHVDLSTAEPDPVHSAAQEALAVRGPDQEPDHSHGHHPHHHGAHPHDPKQPHSHHHDHSDHTHDHHGHDHGPSRHLPEIRDRIQGAKLTPRAEHWSIGVFAALAIAEGAVHGQPPEQVHFHEVGATDALVDIVGTCVGLDWLGVDAIVCSPLPVGGGVVRAAHGRLPVPVPAVLKLWEKHQVPVYYNGIDRELVTPTGAAIATTLAEDFGPPPQMTLTKVGLGAGNRELSLPNILRLWLGEVPNRPGHRHHSQSQHHTASPSRSPNVHPPEHSHLASETADTVTVLETQIDDLSPQAIAYTQHLLLEAGALDVFSQAIAMKKSRLGTLLTVICKPEHAHLCETIIFRETTTLGIRRQHQQRHILQRQQVPLNTPHGPIRVKVASKTDGNHHTQIINIHPEYDDVAACAVATNTPWLTVHQGAIEQWKQGG